MIFAYMDLTVMVDFLSLLKQRQCNSSGIIMTVFFEFLLSPQFVLPHSRGSSHGQTRVIRKTYDEDVYIQMMHESYELWVQLEREAGVELYR